MASFLPLLLPGNLECQGGSGDTYVPMAAFGS